MDSQGLGLNTYTAGTAPGLGVLGQGCSFCLCGSRTVMCFWTPGPSSPINPAWVLSFRNCAKGVRDLGWSVI